MVIFQYNLYIFVWIKHSCLTNMVNAMDPNNSVIKRLWCIHNTTGNIQQTKKLGKPAELNRQAGRSAESEKVSGLAVHLIVSVPEFTLIYFRYTDNPI